MPVVAAQLDAYCWWVLLLRDENLVRGRILNKKLIRILKQAVSFSFGLGNSTPINQNLNSQPSIGSTTNAKGLVEKARKKKDSEREEGKSYL
jgi:hypothetical protein